MVVGLAIFKLAPAILHPENLSPQDSVVVSVLGGFALLAVVGIRYPIKMLPLLFFDIPTAVQLAVWQRDGGKCVVCVATDELHFEHDLPYSKGAPRSPRITCN
jgi:hypothetical protein